MQDAHGVHAFQRFGNLVKNVSGFFRVQRTGFQAVGQRPAGHPAHDDVQPPAGFGNFHDRHNPRRFQQGQQAHFLFKKVAPGRVAVIEGRHHFDRHLAFKIGIFGVQHNSRPAAGKLAFDFVTLQDG